MYADKMKLGNIISDNMTELSKHHKMFQRSRCQKLCSGNYTCCSIHPAMAPPSCFFPIFILRLKKA
jgi:hypothetical protein